MANYSKLLSLINGVGRTIDFSNPSNVLELGGGLQMDGSTSGHIVMSASATTTTYSVIWPAAQAASAGYVLTNDGTGQLSWSNPSSGSVTSVALALPVSVFSVSGSPVTSSGTLTGSLQNQNANFVWAGPTTGSAAAPTFRALVSADIPNNAANTSGTASNITASSNSTLTSLSALTSASSLASVGTITSGVWNGTTIAIANGGTGQVTASAAFDALSPMTTKGDIIFENASAIADRLPIGTTGQVLTVAGGVPVWSAPATSGTVTSVALADGSTAPIYSISGSPVTSSGTLTLTLENQSANMVFAGPSSGSAAQPSFRSLVSSDIPSLSAIYLPLAGGTMSGAINMGGHQINNMADPSSAQDAATKSYVDAAINGLTWKGPANAYANSNVPLTGGATLTIDGYAVQNGDLVILGNQTTASQNGEYSVSGIGTAYTLTANGQPSAAGDAWLVLNGTVYGDSAFVATAAVPAAAFVEFAGPNALNFSAPLSISGNTVSLNFGNGLALNSGNLIANLGNGLVFSGSAIAVEAADTSINVSGSGIKVAVDAAGAIVTGGSGIKVQVQNGIQITGNKLDILVADNSLLDNSSGLAVKLDPAGALVTGASGVKAQTDGSTVGINGSNELYVPNAGITEVQIASSALSSTGALAGGSGTKLSVKVDNSTIDINGSDQIEVKAAGITSTQLASASVTAAKLATVTDGVTLDQAGAGSTIEIKPAGVSATQLATGAFDQITIVGGAGTVASVAQAPKVRTAEISDEALSSSTLYALRYALSTDGGSTPGHMWRADDDASSVDNFYVIGLAYPPGAVSPGGAVNVVEEGLINVPSHGFTTGAPLYLGSAGALTSTPPSSAGLAIVKVGQVKDANNIWVAIEVMGVN